MNNQNMGYYHSGLGRVVYFDDHQMQGNFLKDLWSSVTGGAKTAAQRELDKFKDSIAHLPQAAKEAAMRDFLKSGTGQALTEEAKKTWLEQQQEKAVAYYVQNKQTVNLILLGSVLALGAYIILRKPARRQAIRQRVSSYVPGMSNPRRRKVSRRKKKKFSA